LTKRSLEQKIFFVKKILRVFKYRSEDWINPGWEFLKRAWRKDGPGLESLEDTVSKLREDEGYFVFNGGLLRLWSRRYWWAGDG
jgi:hypothetical protein